MSAGAVFRLIANDGKADRLITATQLLNARLQEVQCDRRAQGLADDTPTLVDIEKTHILYVNAHFKPYAAIGFEYNKVRPQAGSPAFGSGVTFSIPQFGDFFHDMVVRVRLSKCQAVAGTTPTQITYPVGPAATAGTAANVATSLFPDINTAVPVAWAATTTATVTYVDAFGAILGTGNAGQSYQNMIRYCEYPGNRLFRKVSFDVNGNPLDSYSQMVPTMLEKFTVAPNKRIGHDRLVGQEVPVLGYGGLSKATVSDADAASTGNTVNRFVAGQNNATVALYDSASTLSIAPAFTALNGASGVALDISRQVKSYVNGPQTPKPIQPPLEIWNKLQFWFCNDVRLSVPSVSIPQGQRFITIELEAAAKLVYEVPSLYRKVVFDETPGAAGARLATSYSLVPLLNGVTAPTIESMDLYINNIFLNPEIHDIYIKRIGFSLIRVYVEHTQQLNAESNDVLLSQIKWPIEFLMAGLRPLWNVKDPAMQGGSLSGNLSSWRDWHRFTRVVDSTISAPISFSTEPGVAPISSTSITQVQSDSYYLAVPTADSISLKTHGITIFDSIDSAFFNQYMPYHYGDKNINTPDDLGVLFINLALFPRSYQPSGHLNISRARETYLSYRSSIIKPSAPAQLDVVGIAINFLLVTDGSAVLRYST